MAPGKQAEGAVFSAKSQYEMALHGATKEQVGQINARYKAAEEQYNFAKKSMERVKNMFKDSLISAQKYDETFAKFNIIMALVWIVLGFLIVREHKKISLKETQPQPAE